MSVGLDAARDRRTALVGLAAGPGRASVALAVLGSVLGLHLSYDFDLPTGSGIVRTAGAIWLASLALGPQESLARRHLRRPHLAG